MIRKSGYRFFEKIMLKQKIERDDDSKKRRHALVPNGLFRPLLSMEMARTVAAKSVTPFLRHAR